jgi:VWFA-related protein
MLRIALTAAVIVFLAGGPPAAQQAPQQPSDSPVFRGSVQSIEVDVRVTDREGRIVRGLTRDDFTLLEDGKAQSIVTASFIDLEVESPITRMIPGVIDSDVTTNAGVGRMWVVLLGSSAGDGPSGRASRARGAARLFVEQALGPNDQVAIINVHGTMSMAQGFTRNRTLLLEAIDRLDEQPSNPFNTTRTAYQVLEDVSNRLGRLAGRKAILFFDPPAFYGPEGPPALDSQGRAASRQTDVMDYNVQRDALAAATRNNVAIYVVSTTGIQGVEPDRPAVQPGGTGLLKGIAGQQLLADETGGDAIVNTNNYRQGYERFVQDSNQYYLLGYSPEVEHRDGDFHRVTVRVNRPGLIVRARTGYYAPGRERPARQANSGKDAPKEKLSPAALEALRMPLSMGGLTVDLFAAPFRGKGNVASVLVGAQVHGSGLMLSRGEKLEVGFIGTNSEGKTSPGAYHIARLDLADGTRQIVERSGLPFVDRLQLKAGRHQVKFVAHQASGKTGMVVADVEVPDFSKGPLSMSGIVLATPPPAPQAVFRKDATMQRFLAALYPTSTRRFSRRDVLTAYLEVYTTGDAKVSQAVAQITRAGENRPREYPVAPFYPAPGQAVIRRQFPLRDLEAGDYILSFEARADKRTASRRVLFTVVP